MTFTDSKRQYSINSNEEIKYVGIKNDENNNLQLSITSTVTESRAVILKVSVTSEGEDNTLTESKLRELEENNLEQTQNYFVQAYRTFSEENGAPESFLNQLSWNYLVAMYSNSGGTGNPTIHDIYNKFLTREGFSSAYDFIIKNLNSVPLTATFTCTGNESVTGINAEFIVTNPTTIITATVSNNGDYIEEVWDEYPDEKKETYSEIQNSNYTITQGDYTAVVPAGFAYGTSANVSTISNGLVITDKVENGYSIGNEFVWIPVKNDLTVGKNKAEATNTGKVMAEKIGETDYRGILYDFSSNTPSAIEFDPDWCREPDDVDWDTQTNYISYGVTTSGMQANYNAMIESVKQFGGFYVGRYEMGKGENYSKIGVEPTSAYESETSMWYGLYNKAKAYNKTGVTAEMIWGSQYDAMLNFALTNSSDSAKVNANTNGNHAGKMLKTGIWLGEGNKTDRINNIFDLEGNMIEWTKEAGYNDNRVFRGSSYDDPSIEGYGSPSFRNTNIPTNTLHIYSSRLSLYIN